MLNILLSIFWPFEMLLLRILCLVLYPIFLICYLELWCLISCVLYIIWRSVIWCGLGKGLFPFSRLPFCLSDCVLCFTETSQFRRSHLFIVSLSVCATMVIFRKWSPVSMCLSVLPTFFSMRFSVTGFMLRSLIHLYSNFVHGDSYGSIYNLPKDLAIPLLGIYPKDAQLYQDMCPTMFIALLFVIARTWKQPNCS